LAAILDLLTPKQQESAIVYRVKPLDQFNKFGNKSYIRKQYVVVTADGMTICSCLFGRNHGIPCRHFFSVLNCFRQDITFNISQVHPKWIIPDKQDEALTREWI